LQYRGESVLPNRLELLQQLRGSKICLVPQDPLGALNPSFTVGWQVSEILRSRFGVGRRDAKRRALALLEQVQLDRPKERYRQYPHQLSGGMRQRVLIAIALAPGPDVLILDEPTTALDVSVEAEILRLLLDLQRERNMAVLLVTHDLGVAAVMSDEVAVMYGGRIAEIGPASEILQRPVHPYTQGLVASVPRIDGELTELRPIGGEPPVLTDLPRGCPFATRCPEVFERCWDDAPDLLPITNAQHLVACHRRRPVDMSIASSEGGSS
jgi:oligopeptide/dipeptide ABC transporter ATP-binding protein